MTRESTPMFQGKHLKLGSIATFIIALFSAPGFVSWIGNGSHKAEVAYEVLQAEVDSMNVSNQRLLEEVRILRATMIQLHTSGSAPSPAPTIGIGLGGSGMGFGSGVGVLSSLSGGGSAVAPDAPVAEEEEALEMACGESEEGELECAAPEPEVPAARSTAPDQKKPKLLPLEELLGSDVQVEKRPELPDTLDALL